MNFRFDLVRFYDSSLPEDNYFVARIIGKHMDETRERTVRYNCGKLCASENRSKIFDLNFTEVISQER